MIENRLASPETKRDVNVKTYRRGRTECEREATPPRTPPGAIPQGN